MKEFFKKIIVFIIQYESKLVLKKYKPKIIVVVGSVGKTTTKDAIYTVLRDSFFVRKSEKSFNSEIGLPLTILGLENGWTNPLLWFKNIFEGAVLAILPSKYPDWLVLEVGADQPGDIKGLSEWLAVDVAVITRFPDVPVHVEFFDSPQAVIEEKLSIIDALKEDGTLVLNVDDEKIAAVREKLVTRKIVSVGVGKNHDVGATHIGVISKDKVPQGTRFHLHIGEQEKTIELEGVLGKQHVYPSLSAAAVGHALGLEGNVIAEGLSLYKPVRGRMRILPGLKQTTLIDDTYNSSPIALEEALNVLSQVETRGRKIAVLGDMLELGKFSIDAHRKAGKKAAEVSDIVMTLGFRSRDIAEGALQNGMHPSKLFQYDDVKRLGKELEHMLEEGDLVLLKGSQGSGQNMIRLERVVEEVMAEPQRKNELLVRQDKEWKQR